MTSGSKRSGDRRDGPVDFATLASIYGGFAEARILQEAVRAGVFDTTEAPSTVDDVAGSCGLEPRACRLLLDALVGMELLERIDAGGAAPASNDASASNGDGAEAADHGPGPRYRNASGVDELLTSGGQRTLVPIIRFNARLWDVWGRLDESLRTGEPARVPDMFQDDPQQLEDFILGMRSIATARGDADHLPQAVDLSDDQRMLDVGAGPGTYSRAFLQAHPDLRATLFDLPATCKVTRDVVATWPADVQQRVTIVEGDFTEDPFPGGQDVVWISNILHSEPEEGCRDLLAKARDALRPGGRLILKDHWLDPSRTRPRRGATFSITMLLATRGRCYSLEEVTTWLDELGFADVEERPLADGVPQSLLVAQR